jgi:FKBP-type peptidyl-prolyl cis-trans isomerase
MNFWRTAIAGGLLGLGLCGCDDPGDLGPVAPPGAIIPRVAPEAEPAQAVGETAPSALASASTPTTSPPPKSAKLANMKPAPPTAKGETKTTEGGVKYETLNEGTGAELQPGQTATIHYEGKLENGTVFENSSLDAAIGVRPLIKGWEEGIPGMKVGEKRKLTIPPAMGYGASGSPPTIPPNATLIFEVELIRIAGDK